MSDFDHILGWKLLRGSHSFPGPDGGTCINEAAVVACGFPYQSVSSIGHMPKCFSRPICQLAMQLNDEATDTERQRLMPFVTRLACSDTPKIERERTYYISTRLDHDLSFVRGSRFDQGLKVLEGALAIGRQADPLGLGEVANRLDAVRSPAQPVKKKARFLPAMVEGWLGLQYTLENAG